MRMATERELFTKVETLQNMLVAGACGGVMDDADYMLLRRELLAIPRVKRLLPTFVETCRSEFQFWQFIKDHDRTAPGHLGSLSAPSGRSRASRPRSR